AEDGNDELSALAKSFNQLSARTRVVLGMVDKIPSGASPEQVFDLLWSESRDHLGHDWQALFDIDPRSREATLAFLNQHESVGFKRDQSAYPIGGILNETAKSSENSWALESIRTHTLDQTESKLLRELSRRGLQRLVLVMLQDDQAPRARLLAFAWSGQSSEHPGISRFLSSLGRFFSSLMFGRRERVERTSRAEAATAAEAEA
ncbi:MAG: hypothetical protein LC637_02990, partial [Xanthomonadaceae bacterium]|nr:hypothetical protein [Xanthomonadaceae bacterium]